MITRITASVNFGAPFDRKRNWWPGEEDDLVGVEEELVGVEEELVGVEEELMGCS